MGSAIKGGTTNVSTIIRIIDNTTGLPEEGVEHNTSGIALWYRRDVDPGSTPLAKVTITPAALAALTTAHADGGIEHIDDGYYRLDLEDVAVAGGAIGVMIGGTITGMMVIGNYHPLVDYDPNDTIRMGLTALPAAAADAAGGLPISDDGGLDIDEISVILADTNELQIDDVPGLIATLDAVVDTVKDETVLILADTADIQPNYATEAKQDTAQTDLDTISDGIIKGTAATGTLSTTQCTTNLSGFTDDQLIGRIITFLAGPADGESSDITDYANTNGLITFTAMTLASENGNAFKIT